MALQPWEIEGDTASWMARLAPGVGKERGMTLCSFTLPIPLRWALHYCHNTCQKEIFPETKAMGSQTYTKEVCMRPLSSTHCPVPATL